MVSQIPMPPLAPVMPEILLCCAALIIMMIDLFVKKKEVVAVLSIVAALIVSYNLMGVMGTTFDGMFLADKYSAFFKYVFLINLVLTILVSVKYLEVERADHGEYYVTMMFATIGMMVMASAGDLVTLYLGLELMALSTYILAGFIRQATRSNEAAIKYLLLGAFASGFLLYGISLIYGMTGSTNLSEISTYISKNGLTGNPALMLSILMFTVAFCFKIAAVPFHMWAPDVYEGAPTSITAFMSVGPKAAGFAVFGRVFLVAFGQSSADWSVVLIVIALATMAVGNIVALAQTNIKRMLAYSSIAHAGYAMLGIIAGGQDGMASMMNYMLVYAFMNIGAFAIVILLRREGFMGEDIRDYEGLSKTHPLYAAIMLVFMFSLTGIPPTAGFMGKFYLFMAAINAGYHWVVAVAVIFSAISAYFYLRIVMYMYMREPHTEVGLTTSPYIYAALILTTAGVLAIGIMPSQVIAMAKSAALGF